MGVFIALCTGRKPQMQETINNQQKILQIIHQGISTGIEILLSKAIVTIKPNYNAYLYYHHKKKLLPRCPQRN